MSSVTHGLPPSTRKPAKVESPKGSGLRPISGHGLSSLHGFEGDQLPYPSLKLWVVGPGPAGSVKARQQGSTP